MRTRTTMTHWLLLLLLLMTVGTGCTRRFFRKRTDDDVVGLMSQKNQFPSWKIENWYIYPDPRSRFADPTNPDRPPKPKDDYAAYVLSPDPQPRKYRIGDFQGNGYLAYMEAWDTANRAQRERRVKEGRGTPPALDGAPNSTASEDFRKALLPTNKAYLINDWQSTDLAMYNSRENQDRREDLYGAALPVMLQRFAFVSQFSATEQAIRQISGRAVPGGAASLWNLNSTAGASKLFPTGATLLLKLANQLVIDVGNGKPAVGLSSLSVDLTQPLLAGGGFAVTMEPLTQAERTLLYGIRSYARFRKIYYTYLIGGNNNIFNTPYSLTGLALRGVGPTLTAAGQGFYPTVLLAALQRSEIDNQTNLEKYWKVFQAIEEGGDVSRLQVDQVEQQLLSSRTRLLLAKYNLQTGLDLYKLQIGLPTQTQLELDDDSLRVLYEHLARYNQTRDEFDMLRREAGDFSNTIRRQIVFIGGGITSVVPFDLPIRPRLRNLIHDSKAVANTKFREKILDKWQRWEKMNDEAIQKTILQLTEEQRVIGDTKSRLDVEGKPIPPEVTQRSNELRADINLAKFELTLRIYERKPWLKERGPGMTREQTNLFRDVANSFVLVVGEAREERNAQIRHSWPDLQPIIVEGTDLLHEDLDKAHAAAAQVALSNRLELMNARAQAVDAWRQIAVTANALMGVLNVGYQYNGNSPTGTNQPLNVGGSHATNQLVINGELPLVRMNERINYRTAQINYQRARRVVQATEDFILNDVRTDLRNVRQWATNYVIQQRAVEVAYTQVENSLEALQAPPDPRVGTQAAGNAAALTQQLLNAQTSLLTAQNTLYTIWMNYLIFRQLLYRDLEFLPLDQRGAWIDEYIPDWKNRTGNNQSNSGINQPGGECRPQYLPDPIVVPDRKPSAPETGSIIPSGAREPQRKPPPRFVEPRFDPFPGFNPTATGSSLPRGYSEDEPRWQKTK